MICSEHKSIPELNSLTALLFWSKHPNQKKKSLQTKLSLSIVGALMLIPIYATNTHRHLKPPCFTLSTAKPEAKWYEAWNQLCSTTSRFFTPFFFASLIERCFWELGQGNSAWVIHADALLAYSWSQQTSP